VGRDGPATAGQQGRLPEAEHQGFPLHGHVGRARLGHDARRAHPPAARVSRRVRQTGPFLLLSYRAGPDSKLSQTAGHKLGPSLRVYVRIGAGTGVKLDVPYNPLTGRYQIEIWGYGGNDLRNKLGEKGQAAFDRGGLIANPALVQGSYADFAREGLDNRDMRTVAPNNIMHPVLPLAIELAWADKTETWWDSRSGANYHHRWIIYRGWDNYLQVGISEAPHGGFGFLHFRNVLSNYFAFRRRFSSFDRNRHHGHRRLVPVPGPRALLRDQDHDGRQLQPA
jgi:hypothetical protein